MRSSVRTLMWYLATHHDLGEPILDIGARASANQIYEGDLRQLLKGKEYIGCDAVRGIGVDQVEDIEHLSFADKSAKTILCLDTLEHVANPRQAMSEIARVIADDGVVVVTSHMYAPVHYEPDYWRFTPQCFADILFKDFHETQRFVMGEANFPELIGAIATVNAPIPFTVDWQELNSMLLWSYPFRYAPI